MGSVSLKIGEGTARFKRATIWSSTANVVMLLSVLTTNLFALYAFTYKPHQHHFQQINSHLNNNNMSVISEQVSLILRQIEASQRQLAQMEKQILGYETLDLSRPNTANELKLFLQHHNLPLGKDSRSKITEMVSSVGNMCETSIDSLNQYMNYKINRPCPDDWSLGQKLILQGCEPLPRQRCFAKSNPKEGLYSFPNSLWKNVSNRGLSWSGLGCKSLNCLIGKKLTKDCVNCFDLTNGVEKERFIKSRGKNDFTIDDVLSLANNGIRIGFDLGGGSGTFGARMAEKNVTIITTTLNIDAPFSEFIAARGLFPLYLSLDHRFPFYDNIFDLVHVSNGLDFGGKSEKLEFIMFDIDRILRSGGLLWVDNYFCTSDEKKTALTRLIEKFGYKKLKWVVGEKVNGAGNSEVYLSAVLQKPARV